MTRLFHPLLALIASAGNSELAKYVEYLKHENKILRARIPGEIHRTPEFRLGVQADGLVPRSNVKSRIQAYDLVA